MHNMVFRDWHGAVRLIAVWSVAFSAMGQIQFKVISGVGSNQSPVGIAEGSPGVFYSHGAGAPPAAFSITLAGQLTTLYAFPLGTNIASPLVSDANHRFYSSIISTTSGASNIFSVGSAASSGRTHPNVNLLPTFSQNMPNGVLLGIGSDYTTDLSYLVTGEPNGTVKPIYEFPQNFSSWPPIRGADGNYYGVGWSEIGANPSYIYQITPDGGFKVVYNLPDGSTGNLVSFPLIQGTDGNFYGVTPYGGGQKFRGTLYRLTPDGTYTLLHTFGEGPGAYPHALIQASDGNLYGASLGYGGPSSLFRSTTSGQFTELLQLGSYGECPCYLTQGADGVIYGMIQSGGPNGNGAFFELDAALPKPAPRSQHFSPGQGPSGTRVLLWGYNLLGASVTFNGAPASAVSVSGPNYITAVVPSGATSGPITITGPGGSWTTSNSFVVEP
jgi:uncharacterized repeat protein (TIGR03803 family)